MTITLPDEMRESLERKAAVGGFASVNEYVADVLAADEMPDFVETTRGPDFRTREELEKLIDEGMASGVAGEMDDAFWARLDARIRDRAAQQAGSP